MSLPKLINILTVEINKHDPSLQPAGAAELTQSCGGTIN